MFLCFLATRLFHIMKVFVLYINYLNNAFSFSIKMTFFSTFSIFSGHFQGLKEHEEQFFLVVF